MAARYSAWSPTALPTPTWSLPCTRSSEPKVIRSPRAARSRRPGRRSGSSLPPCCARYRRNRSSRCHSVPSGWPPIATWSWRSGWMGIPAGERATGIPVGLYAAGGLESPVFLDAIFCSGPEAAHLNITGVSGLATKTSAVEFMLGSIFQTFPAHKGTVAALCFNVKGPDLCFLDQPASAERRGPAAVRPARADSPALRAPCATTPRSSPTE